MLNLTSSFVFTGLLLFPVKVTLLAILLDLVSPKMNNCEQLLNMYVKIGMTNPKQKCSTLENSFELTTDVYLVMQYVNVILIISVEFVMKWKLHDSMRIYWQVHITLVYFYMFYLLLSYISRTANQITSNQNKYQEVTHPM